MILPTGDPTELTCLQFPCCVGDSVLLSVASFLTPRDFPEMLQLYLLVAIIVLQYTCEEILSTCSLNGIYKKKTPSPLSVYKCIIKANTNISQTNFGQ